MKTPMLKIGLLLIFIFFSLTFSDCKKEENKTDFIIVNIEDETDWDYLVAAKDGSSLYLKAIEEVPSLIYYKPLSSQEGYTIFLDEYGRPSKVVLQNNIFVFNNYRPNLVDVAQINSEGEIIVFRDLATKFDLTTGLKGENKGSANIRETLEIASMSASTAACVVGIIWAGPTGGVSAAVGCGLLVLDIVLELIPDEPEILGFSSEAVGQFVGVLGCIRGDPACIFDMAAAAFDIAAASRAKIELDEVKVCEADDIITGGTKQGLIAYFPFNDLAKDESGNGNNGTIYLATATKDRFNNTNKAYNFNGYGNLIEVPHNSTFTSTKQISISAWTYVPNTWVYNSHWIVCKETNWSCGFGLGIDQNDSYYGTGNYAFEFYCWTIVSKYAVLAPITPAKLKQWNHVVGVIDGTSMKLYLNGEMATSVDLTGTLLASDNPVHIGAQNYRKDQNFTGTIDDVRIYNRALTPAEIKILYHEFGW